MNVITLSALAGKASDPRMQEYVRKFTARLPELARAKTGPISAIA